MLSILFLTAATASRALAAPLTTCFTDTFDDLTALPAGTTPVKNYNGLNYGAFRAVAPIAFTAPMIPVSSPNEVTATLRDDILDFVGAGITLHPFGTISVASTTSSFDLKSLYYGCVETVQQGVSPAMSCVFTVTGYDSRGNQVPTQMLSYAPSGLILNQMALATFPESYSNLQNVTIGVAVGGLGVDSANIAIVLDNVVHCNRRR